MSKLLIVPGRGGSGEAHWQTYLERATPGSVRVQQEDWDAPDLAAWAARLDATVRRLSEPPLAVAHSFGCLALAHADRVYGTPFKASFLVAPADPRRFALADGLVLQRLSHRSELLASTNDPWLSLERVEVLAEAWGSRLHVLGALGHINVDSGFGPWPEMQEWVLSGAVAFDGRPRLAFDEVICI